MRHRAESDLQVLLEQAAAASGPKTAPAVDETTWRVIREAAERGDPTAWRLLGWLHWHRYLAIPDRKKPTRGRDDLESAITALTPSFIESAGPLPARMIPGLAIAAMDHAVNLREEAFGAHDPELVSKSVVLWQRIVAAAPAKNPRRAVMLDNLALALENRFGRFGDITDLEEAVSAHRQAARIDPNYAIVGNLGMALRNRFERLGNAADLEEAVEVGRKAVGALPPGDPRSANNLNNLGTALQTRFERFGNAADLEEAVEVGRKAVDATQSGDPRLASRLSNLGSALQTRFDRFAATTDLDEAVRVKRQALEAAAANPPLRASLLNGLGITLVRRFEHLGGVADLDEAVDAMRRSLDATPPDHPQHAVRLTNLGSMLRKRFILRGATSDVDQAVSLLRQAVDTTPTNDPQRARRLSNLGDALHDRFTHTGAPADLQQAVEAVQMALEATPADHPFRAARLVGLGGHLQVRFQQFGAAADLDGAVEYVRQAVALTPADDPFLAIRLSFVAIALRLRSERFKDPADINEAVRFAQRAVDTCPADPVWNRASVLGTLGSTWQTRFDRFGEPADLDRAVEVLKRAVEPSIASQRGAAGAWSNLGLALRCRFDLAGAAADLDEAINAIRNAVDVTALTDVNRDLMLVNLGWVLRTRFNRLADRSDAADALAAFEEAVDLVSAPPSWRIEAGRMGGALAQRSGIGDPVSLLEKAVFLLPDVAPRRLGSSDKLDALTGFSGIASDAAAAALDGSAVIPDRDRAVRALRLLETGRAVLHSQTLETRSDLTDLQERHPDLAGEYVRLRRHLDQSAESAATAAMALIATSPGESMPAKEPVPQNLPEDRHRLADDFASLVTRIRALDGFARFQLPPTPDELLAEAAPGPIVVFNVARRRSDAILVTRGGVRLTPLPGLSRSVVVAKITAFNDALTAASDSGLDSRERREAQAILGEVLEWLWDNAAWPVIKDLGLPVASVGDPPRVWFATGGLLGLLPLHAAGYHRDRKPHDTPRAVMDFMIPSSIPTIRALRYARERLATATTPTRTLIVAMPTTPGAPPLRGVSIEAAMLRSLLPHATVLIESDDSVLRDDTPTRKSVLSHLAESSIVHFACHGTSEPSDPSRSRLLLHDHEERPLNVAEVASSEAGNARLAYLSACQTAVNPSMGLIDESLHLTSAFQLAGFPHAVGTLWKINDSVAVEIARDFYSDLLDGSGGVDVTRSAHALHRAVRTMRDRYPQSPSLWAAYMHAGA